MIGRTGFCLVHLLYSLGVSGFIYPITLVTGRGVPTASSQPWDRLATSFPTSVKAFHDFAGSTVVHTIGGFIALAGSIVLGPRLGRKFKRDGGSTHASRTT